MCLRSCKLKKKCFDEENLYLWNDNIMTCLCVCQLKSQLDAGAIANYCHMIGLPIWPLKLNISSGKKYFSVDMKQPTEY